MGVKECARRDSNPPCTASKTVVSYRWTTSAQSVPTGRFGLPTSHRSDERLYQLGYVGENLSHHSAGTDSRKGPASVTRYHRDTVPGGSRLARHPSYVTYRVCHSAMIDTRKWSRHRDVRPCYVTYRVTASLSMLCRQSGWKRGCCPHLCCLMRAAPSLEGLQKMRARLDTGYTKPGLPKDVVHWW